MKFPELTLSRWKYCFPCQEINLNELYCFLKKKKFKVKYAPEEGFKCVSVNLGDFTLSVFASGKTVLSGKIVSKDYLKLALDKFYKENIKPLKKREKGR